MYVKTGEEFAAMKKTIEDKKRPIRTGEK